jgi:hypothetical protein
VKLSPLSTLTTLWATVTAPDDDKGGTVGGMRGRGN